MLLPPQSLIVIGGQQDVSSVVHANDIHLVSGCICVTDDAKPTNETSAASSLFSEVAEHCHEARSHHL
jgi:hypothetical protein